MNAELILNKIKRIEQEQNRMQGQADMLKKQLKDMGYKTIGEAKKALEELDKEHESLSIEIGEMEIELEKRIDALRKKGIDI
jgi:uncharacterized protein YlxW (UPF0749 family)